MKKLLFTGLCLLLIAVSLPAQSYTPTAANQAARAEFQNMKFGMFIHWGASSVLGSGEWVMNNRNIRVKEYQQLQKVFNPIDFNAKAWVDAAQSAGMNYITIITRHHDGFSNWDTRASDWKITKTPYGKDALKQLADECHARGMKIFFIILCSIGSEMIISMKPVKQVRVPDEQGKVTGIVIYGL